MGGISCGSQVTICDYPIHFDTYTGCSHGCRYCFAQMKVDIRHIRVNNCVEQLRRFIDGKRTNDTCWCDFNIPIHWVGMSDPFQPAEAKYVSSLKCLEVFRETQYPVIISTKGSLICKEPYLSVLRECNAVVQVSMLCSSYDRIEPGAPTYEERIEMVRTLSANCRRVIARAQPYMIEVRREFLDNVPRLADAGAYGITVEGMKFKRKKPGLVKVDGDFCYPEHVLKPYYIGIREACHESGMAFFCAENRRRLLGDSLACCGCGDLDGFEGNSFNLSHLRNGDSVRPSETMKKDGTGSCFKTFYQEAGKSSRITEKPFAVHMLERSQVD